MVQEHPLKNSGTYLGVANIVITSVNYRVLLKLIELKFPNLFETIPNGFETFHKF